MINLWWEQISGARRLLEAIASDVEEEKNVILYFSPGTPWINDFRTILADKLGTLLIDREIKLVSYAAADVGVFMLENYCPKEVRYRYRPPKSVGTFLGEGQSLTLSDQVIWLRLEDNKQLESWLSFIADYKQVVNKKSRKAIFIVELAEAMPELQKRKHFKQYDIGQKIPEYVRYTFASILASEAGVKETLVSYLSQLLTSCCDDVELIPLCIEQYQQFLWQPYTTMLQLVLAKERSDGSAFVAVDADEFASRVWVAQLKILFPYVERYRVYILKKLMKQINERLQFPYKTNFGDLEAAEELELKDIIYALGTGRLTMNDAKEYNRLASFLRFRNSLAHGNPLAYEDVRFLLENYAG